MPRKPGAVVQYKCRTCGATFPTFSDMGRHAAEHRAAGNRGSIPPVAGVSRETPGPRRIEDVSGPASAPPGEVPPASDGSPSLPGDPAGPDSPQPTGGRLRPSRPQLSQPAIRISPEQRTESVRDSIRDALPMQTLADLLHAISVAISEADGAGPAGYLSPIQCTQVAVLLYDSTVDLVASRFDGNVSRFKAGMAVVLILTSKGTVHARAIRQKLDERRAVRPLPVPLPAPEAPIVDDSTNGHAPAFIPGIPIPPGMADTYADALARQQAMQQGSEG